MNQLILAALVALAVVALALALVVRGRRLMPTFEAPVIDVQLDASAAAATFTVDPERRTITGLAVPFGTAAPSRGRMYQFGRGSLKWSDPTRVKLLIGHDFAQAVGYASQLEETDAGLVATFKVARGPKGDEALSLAEDKVLDGLSIGLGVGGQFESRDGVNHASSAPLAEISLTPCPSFDDARLVSVAADQRNAGAPAGDPVDFAALTQGMTGAVRDAIREAFGNLNANPQGGREVIPSADTVVTREEIPYRFDGSRGQHGFIADIRDAYGSNDQEARQRVETFMDEAFATFAVTPANVAALNPTRNRPELYVPNLTFTRPLWELVTTGVLEDQTPFTVPKFASASGLVGDHTSGVEPTPGAFTATPQTVTPAPLSGKIEILREVWDQGGSPQADGIIWGEMQNAYFESIEAKIAARLKTTTTPELNLAGVVDGPLQAALISYLSGLQFVRGGNRFTAFAADGKLFPALTGAKDGSGRPLFPVLGPTNAAGAVDGAFDRVNIGALTVRAAWALAQGANTMSFNFVPSSVWCWASTPKRFTFEYQVKSIDMAIWGYAGTAILRDSDVKPVDYDTADT